MRREDFGVYYDVKGKILCFMSDEDAMEYFIEHNITDWEKV